MARVSEDRVELTGVPPYLSANTGSPSLRGQARVHFSFQFKLDQYQSPTLNVFASIFARFR